MVTHESLPSHALCRCTAACSKMCAKTRLLLVQGTRACELALLYSADAVAHTNTPSKKHSNCGYAKQMVDCSARVTALILQTCHRHTTSLLASHARAQRHLISHEQVVLPRI